MHISRYAHTPRGRRLRRTVAGLLVMVATGSAVPQTAQAQGIVPCTITGTPGNDVLTGTAGNDVLCGGDGNDTLRGLGGDDELRGDGGNDTLLPGPGDDGVVDGSDGTDIVDYRDITGVGVTVDLGVGTGVGP